MQTVLIVLVTAALIEANHYFLDRSRKKMVCSTIATLMNELAVLSGRAGFRTWIDYLEETRGKEESALYLHQLHTTLQKNRVRGGEYDTLLKKLGEYLGLVTGQSGPEQRVLAKKESKSSS